MAKAIKWVVAVLAFLNFGYMAYDGYLAISTGKYVVPADGDYAGHLGPWSKLVSAIGIDPMSSGMKSFFLAWGVMGIIYTVRFILNPVRGRRIMIILNCCTLWYLLAGTLSSLLQLGLLAVHSKVNDKQNNSEDGHNYEA